MKEAAIILASMAFGGLIVGLFLLRGYSVRPSRITLPFVEVDIGRFSNLSPVTFFCEVSAAAIPIDVEATSDALAAAEVTPLFLVHAGWTIACEAFVRRFKAYPDDSHIALAAESIGGQNVEFLRMYREIHSAAIRDPRGVTSEFAAQYLVRAPSLADRIEGRSTPLDSRQRGLVAAAHDILHREQQ